MTLVLYSLLPALLLSHAHISFHFLILRWKVSVALVSNSITCPRAAGGQQRIAQGVQTWWSRSTHYTALASLVAHALPHLPSKAIGSLLLQLPGQPSSGTWALHVRWGIAKEQERSAGPAVLGRHSQGLTSRHISHLLPAKFGLKQVMCLVTLVCWGLRKLSWLLPWWKVC